MSDREELERLIETAFSLNLKYCALVGTRYTPSLNPPCSERDLRELEAHAGMSLPPSYREFLSLHDGWQHFEGNVHLLSAQQQIAGEYADHIRAFKQEQWTYGESLLVEGYIFGTELHANKAWLFDTSRRDARGEMEIVVWQDGETERDADFYEALRLKINRLEILIRKERRRKR